MHFKPVVTFQVSRHSCCIARPDVPSFRTSHTNRFSLPQSAVAKVESFLPFMYTHLDFALGCPVSQVTSFATNCLKFEHQWYSPEVVPKFVP